MVTHVVIFTWIAGTTAEQVENLRQAFDRLAVDMADKAVIKHGPDLHFRDTPGDYSLVATFADRAAWDQYQADPRHKAVVHDVVLPMQAARITVQF
jgi:quinol monooxygenase YgiN